MGYVEGRNVSVEYRWAHNDDGRLPELAAELVRLRVAVIVAPGSTTAAAAAKSATTSIPIVFSGGGDPVQTGLVASLNRPGGNITGVSSMAGELGAKRLGLLQELVPRAARFAVLVNPNNPLAKAFVTDVQTAAAAIGRQMEVLTASTSHDIDIAFAMLAEKSGLTRCWLVQTRCSSAAACSSPRWRCATECLRSTHSARTLRLVG
jgi:ABC-type uncharacterized transport system substrate-binding protein